MYVIILIGSGCKISKTKIFASVLIRKVLFYDNLPNEYNNMHLVVGTY